MPMFPPTAWILLAVMEETHKTVLSGGLPWLADPTTHSAGNNFLALQCGLKTMGKNK